MLHLILIIKIYIQLIFFMKNIVKNFNCCIISPTTKVKMLILVRYMKRQLPRMKITLRILFLLLKLMKVYWFHLISMIMLLLWSLLKNIFPKNNINNFKRLLLSLAIMKHMVFMIYFKENKRITILSTKSILCNNNLVF